jgi:hypothetical protein
MEQGGRVSLPPAALNEGEKYKVMDFRGGKPASLLVDNKLVIGNTELGTNPQKVNNTYSQLCQQHLG